jgi:hypothetical protein
VNKRNPVQKKENQFYLSMFLIMLDMKPYAFSQKKGKVPNRDFSTKSVPE